MAADEEPAAEVAPPTCPPCRGTGRVVSRLGGSSATVTCPWCEGTGHVIPGHDAAARWRAKRGGDDGPSAA
jgi:DnaJ-class molecular chaperone